MELYVGLFDHIYILWETCEDFVCVSLCFICNIICSYLHIIYIEQCNFPVVVCVLILSGIIISNQTLRKQIIKKECE